ncbi:Mechanosensitive ion channel [Moritella viscosa]|uniref:hypothetical protein n=1 Tax=Moritella viscosa TaxID=80854 RepID=UPI0005091DA8|nr:hypothetical protein [Moritella viscosa]CED61486.1 membrane protein [Moritella viscosa]SHO05530.1 Mechanosensitive ion channel [Moritella viscosa]SHO21448.1 Mechanosensitive ion channel [Moritella viscosa]
MELGIFGVVFVVVAGLLFCVLKWKSYRAMLYSGGLLMALGLVASSLSILYVELFISEIDPDVISFQKHLLSNMFLIVAAIGANLFATAVCSKVKQREGFINDKVKYEIEVKQVE